jgi:hypothetical protein
MSPLEHYYLGFALGLFTGILGTHLSQWLNRRDGLQ